MTVGRLKMDERRSILTLLDQAREAREESERVRHLSQAVGRRDVFEILQRYGDELGQRALVLEERALALASSSDPHLMPLRAT
jgi:hypothetical protein